MKNIILLAGFFFWGQLGQAQNIEKVIAEFDGSRITITYDLIYSESDQKFIISLYSSHNNFQNPISLISGEIGNSVLPGRQKKVIWDVRSELPATFNDDLSIKVKAMAVAGIQLKPLEKDAFKKGSDLNLQWSGGAPRDQIKVGLYKHNVLQQSLTQTNNTNSYQWKIPKNQKPGTYSLSISNASNPSQKSSSSNFKIKPKIPLLVKIGVPIVVGALVGVLVGAGGGGESPTDNGSGELPGPIGPE